MMIKEIFCIKYLSSYIKTDIQLEIWLDRYERPKRVFTEEQRPATDQGVTRDREKNTC